MKLKTLLKYLDPLTEIVVWSNFDEGTPDYSDEPVFKGCVMDCPWSLVNYKLVKADTDNYDGMRAASETNEHGAKIDLLVLEVDMKC